MEFRFQEKEPLVLGFRIQDLVLYGILAVFGVMFFAEHIKSAKSAELKLQESVNITRGVDGNGYFVEVPISPGGCPEGESYFANSFNESAWKERYYELLNAITIPSARLTKANLCKNVVVDLLKQTKGHWVMASHDPVKSRVTIYAVEGGEPYTSIESPAFREDLKEQIRQHTDALFHKIKQVTEANRV